MLVSRIDGALSKLFYGWRGATLLEREECSVSAVQDFLARQDQVEAYIDLPIDPKFPLGEPEDDNDTDPRRRARDLQANGLSRLLGRHWQDMSGEEAGQAVYETVAWNDADRPLVDIVQTRDGDTRFTVNISYQPVYVNENVGLTLYERLGGTGPGSPPSQPTYLATGTPKTRTNTFVTRTLKVRGAAPDYTGDLAAALDRFTPDTGEQVARAEQLLAATDTVAGCMPDRLRTADGVTTLSGEREEYWGETELTGEQAARELQALHQAYDLSPPDILVCEQPDPRYEIRASVSEDVGEDAATVSYVGEPHRFRAAGDVHAFLDS